MTKRTPEPKNALVKQLREDVVFVDLESGGVSVKIGELKTDALLYEAADMIENLEAKLNEAIGLALIQCPFEYGTRGYDDWWQDRYERLAELEGDEL